MQRFSPAPLTKEIMNFYFNQKKKNNLTKEININKKQKENPNLTIQKDTTQNPILTRKFL